MPYWNDKKYRTFREIRDEFGFTDAGTAQHIETCLENGALFAYYQNETSTILVRYQYAKLPRTPDLQYQDPMLLVARLILPEEYDGMYTFADNLMFFAEELAPHDLPLKMNTTAHAPPQENTPTTVNAQPHTPSPIDRVKSSQKNIFAISKRDMARLCGVSEKTIRNWENNKGMPQGYPGRTDEVQARLFAQTYKNKRAINAEWKAIRTAGTGYDIDRFAHSYFYE